MHFFDVALSVPDCTCGSLACYYQSDIKLVTANAKTFNPAGSIYHTEADRIESYALDQIAKAAATVIEYEADWNIDVERDDEPAAVAVDDEDAAAGTPADRVPGTPMDVDESRAGSPSAQAGGGRRARGKKPPGALSESLEADGGLPGAKDGLGAFPAGSDWAELMLALKLKGKRACALFSLSSLITWLQASAIELRRNGCGWREVDLPLRQMEVSTTPRVSYIRRW